MMKRKVVMELQKKAAIEAFVGENIYDYIERKLGIDWRIAVEEKRITPYVQRLIDKSKYFSAQLKGRTQEEGVTQLVFSRCIEHRLLEKWQGEAHLNGSDRDILITEYSSYRPDIKERNCDYYYEIISTYNGQFILNSAVFVRKPKFDYLMDFAKRHNVFIVAVDVLSQEYCFIPIKSRLGDMPYVSEAPVTGIQIDLNNMDWFSLYESDFIVDV